MELHLLTRQEAQAFSFFGQKKILSSFRQRSTITKNMYKHVSKQRKLADQKKQVVLSDESDDSDDEVDNLSSASSGSESGSGSEEEESGDEDEEEEDEEEEQEQVALKPPPASYLTVAEALKDPIVYPVEAGGDATDPEVVCVVCTDKALKKGKMLDVHLASNVSSSFTPKPLFTKNPFTSHRVTNDDSNDSQFTALRLHSLPHLSP